MNGKKEIWKLDRFLKSIQNWLWRYLNLTAVAADWSKLPELADV